MKKARIGLFQKLKLDNSLLREAVYLAERSRAIPDFWRAALFLWKIFFLEARSINDTTFGASATASSLFPAVMSFPMILICSFTRTLKLLLRIVFLRVFLRFLIDDFNTGICALGKNEKVLQACSIWRLDGLSNALLLLFLVNLTGAFTIAL